MNNNDRVVKILTGSLWIIKLALRILGVIILYEIIKLIVLLIAF
jgi:hypothetical protein